jgi:hypothetical protein
MFLGAACSGGDPIFSNEPIPLVLAGPSGGMLGLGTAGSREQTFPMLVDTASPLTAFSDGSQRAHATRGTLRLYGNDPTFGEAPRLELPDIQLFVTSLGGTGLDSANPIAGVLGGDNLRRFVLGLEYTPAPRISLGDRLVLDDCDLSERCGAVLPFSLGGGHQAIDIGEDVYSYPASYVLLDACLEPSLDPLEQGIECRDRGCVTGCPTALGTDRDDCVNQCNQRRAACGGSCNDCDDLCGNPSSQECLDCLADADRFLPHGIDVRLAVSTGFPGLALTAAAYDGLRGRGSAIALGAGHKLYLPDQSPEAAGLGVAVDMLGEPPTSAHDSAARSAIALIARGSYFGACAELARSRRLRNKDPRTFSSGQESCLRSPERYAKPFTRYHSGDALLATCESQNSGACDDRGDGAHVAAYAELQGQIPIIVVPDTTSLLQSINADARPDSATVEGVIGTELLRRLRTTIDYPNSRLVTTCVDSSCRVFPQWGHGTDCQIPTGGNVFGGGLVRSVGGGGCAVP